MRSRVRTRTHGSVRGRPPSGGLLLDQGAVGTGESGADAEDLAEENRRLRRENEHLRRQRDILKKAAAILGEDPHAGMR